MGKRNRFGVYLPCTEEVDWRMSKRACYASSMRDVAPDVSHRLLAPRMVGVIGSRNRQGTDNLAPVSNMTSVSRSPQVVVIAVYREWQTYANLMTSEGFTISIPRDDQLQVVWRLGEKYSGFHFSKEEDKISAAGAEIQSLEGWYGPVLNDAVGWLNCRICEKVRAEKFDHGLFFGEVVGAQFSERDLDERGEYLRNSKPLMQVAGNRFATSSDFRTIPYFE